MRAPYLCKKLVWVDHVSVSLSLSLHLQRASKPARVGKASIDQAPPNIRAGKRSTDFKFGRAPKQTTSRIVSIQGTPTYTPVHGQTMTFRGRSTALRGLSTVHGLSTLHAVPSHKSVCVEQIDTCVAPASTPPSQALRFPVAGSPLAPFKKKGGPKDSQDCHTYFSRPRPCKRTYYLRLKASLSA